jgi:hypothetical protein
MEILFQNMKEGDKYVIWDGINEEPFSKDKIGYLCIIDSNGEIVSISGILPICPKNHPILPIAVFSCKNGQASAEKKFGDKGNGVFTHYCNAVLRSNPDATFRDVISLVNIDMHQEGLEQRAEVVCRIDILDMPMLDVSLPNEMPFTMTLDMCRTELTLAEFKRKFKGPK